MRIKPIVKMLLIGALATLPLLAQESASPPATAADVAQALDQKVQSLTMSDLELPVALADLGKQVGVTISLDDESAELLPWGRQTKLAAVTITNASLRESLPKILGALGMTYQVADQSLVVSATDALRRLGRRASWDELKLLRKANETEYSPQAFAEFKLQYRITSKVDAPKLLTEQMDRSGQGTIAQTMETATGALGWVWSPEEDHIVIRTSQAQTASKLSRRVSARYVNTGLANILLDLGDKADVAFKLEPAMMLKLPPSAGSYSLALQSTSIRQALELIAADTGLEYEIHRDGVAFRVAEASSTAAPRSAGGQVVAKISIPSKDNSFSYEIFLRDDDVPPEFRDHCDQIKQEYVRKLMAELAPDPRIRPGGDGK